MIGLDTNILLRLLLQDDAEQSRRATNLLTRLPEIGPGYINCITLMEFTWFLQQRAKLTRSQVMEGIAGLLESQDLLLEDEQAVEETLGIMETSREEFADIFIAVRNRNAGCSSTMTFDETAARKINGMELVP